MAKKQKEEITRNEVAEKLEVLKKEIASTEEDYEYVLAAKALIILGLLLILTCIILRITSFSIPLLGRTLLCFAFMLIIMGCLIKYAVKK